MVVTNEIFIAGVVVLELLIVIGSYLLVRELRSWRKEIQSWRIERQETRMERQSNSGLYCSRQLRTVLWGPAAWMPGKERSIPIPKYREAK